MKDKLREFLKTGTRKTVMRGESGRYPNGEGWGHSWNEEVVEFNAKKLDAAILDAEGDGGAVGDAVSLESALAAIDHVEQHNGPGRSSQARAMLETVAHPARSGVVSDEDVLAKLYAAASKGFHTSETYGPESKYLHKSKFQTLQDLFDFEDAWRKAMLAAPSAPEGDGGAK